MSGYLASPAFAGPYLADQLIPLFALTVGGAFTTVKPSAHFQNAVDIAQLSPAKLCHKENGSHRVFIR
jgi:RNA 3'-terminal phosphate cyclase (ATP)